MCYYLMLLAYILYHFLPSFSIRVYSSAPKNASSMFYNIPLHYDVVPSYNNCNLTIRTIKRIYVGLMALFFFIAKWASSPLNQFDSPKEKIDSSQLHYHSVRLKFFLDLSYCLFQMYLFYGLSFFL